MEWLAVWIFCGIVAASIASGRGRSGCGWLIILTILAVAIFFTWLPDKYITSSDPRRSPGAARRPS